jgi:hypothetical protein
VGSGRIATHIWWVTALAGIVLAALVWAVWPEPASPMQPAAEVPAAPAAVVTAWGQSRGQSPDRDVGPPPIPSEAELAPDYVAESPEELGAEPLPGAELTRAPEPPPVAG